MVNIAGSLIIKDKTVILSCEIGNFLISDERSKNWPKGKISGFFEIKKISLSQQTSEFNASCILLCELGMVILDHKTKCTNALETLKPDEETSNNKTVSKSADQEQALKQSPHSNKAQIETPNMQHDDFAKLFANDWPLGDKVKLDATEDRATLLKKRKALQALGYQFLVSEQTWVRG